jgi:oxygen-independent coproporphyrinogen-3 oxidase
VNALLADLRFEASLTAGRTVSTIFIGGGTPSLFSARAIGQLLDGVAGTVALSEDCEVTLEANPGAAERERFRGYLSAGVNRLSLGVQSFHDELLRAIGRVHDGKAALAAVHAALSVEFQAVNIDLMYALPGQSPMQAESDVSIACDLGPSHLSHYQLTIEPNTAFAARPPVLPDEENAFEAERLSRERIEAGGYTQYEVSAFALQGRECRHNLNYWRFGDYLGIGAGAHGKLSDWSAGRVVRRAKVRDPQRYLARAGSGSASASTRLLSSDDLVLEFTLNALRLWEGFRFDHFEARTGLSRNALAIGLERAQARGLITRDALGARLSERGRFFLNDAVESFLADDAVGND